MRRLIRALLRPTEHLPNMAVRAGIWATILRIALRLFVLVRAVVLANLLSPDDFGIMGIATITILFLDRFSQGGIESALVQRDDDIEPYLNTAWTWQILRGVGLGGILFLASPLIAAFFRAPEAEPVMRVLSLSIVIAGFANIAVVSFVRDLRFDRHFVLEISDKGTDIVVSIAAAIALGNVWALVLGVLAGSLAKTIVSYLITSFRPRIEWAWDRFRTLFRFGRWVSVGQILSYVATNLDDILVGRIVSVTALGWYRMAYNFSQIVGTEIALVTSQVGFPTYAKLRSMPERVGPAYLNVLHLVAFLGFPVAIGTILIAPDLTYGLLGDQWAPIILPLQLMSIAGLVRGLWGTGIPLLDALGRPDVSPRMRLAKVIVMAVLLVPVVRRWGIDGAAYVVVAAELVAGVMALFAVDHYASIGPRAIAKAMAIPVINTTVMVVAVLAVRYTILGAYSIGSFCVIAFTGLAAYAGAVLVATKVLGYPQFRDLIRRVRDLGAGSASGA